MWYKSYDFYKNLDRKYYEKELCEWYKFYTGKNLDLNNPKSFNEKIQWLKLYDSTELKGLCADKYKVKEWLFNELGIDYSIKTLGVYDKFDDIDFDKLPNSFVLKANHGSGWNIIVKNKDMLDIDDAKKKFDDWMSKDFSFVDGFQMHYQYIDRKIIAEEFIKFDGGLIDYRVHCYNGVPKDIWIDANSGTKNHLRSIYDIDYNKQNVTCTWPDGGEMKKPINYDLMIEISKKISKYFKFVRVDFYEVNSKLYIGELTFTPLSGIGNYNPDSYNLLQGSWIKLRD